jgi:uncharacterized RDD family membrane protein YckC
MSTAPPVVHAPVLGPAEQGAPAGIASRTIAAIIDAVLVLVAVLSGYLCIAGAVFLAHPTGFSFPAPALAVLVPVALAVSAGYLAFCWATSGRTYGDHVLGLRVVGRGGDKLRVRWAVVRAVAYVVVPFGLGWAAVSRDKRSIQDIVLRTSVVYDWD